MKHYEYMFWFQVTEVTTGTGGGHNEARIPTPRPEQLSCGRSRLETAFHLTFFLLEVQRCNESKYAAQNEDLLLSGFVLDMSWALHALSAFYHLTYKLIIYFEATQGRTLRFARRGQISCMNSAKKCISPLEKFSLPPWTNPLRNLLLNILKHQKQVISKAPPP